MTTDPKARVRRYYEALWNSGDLSAVDEVCHHDLVDHWHQQTGTDAWKATVTDLRRTFPDLHFKALLQVAEPGKVVTYWRMGGTDHGGLFRLPPTGRTAEFTGVFIDRLDSHRIIEHWAISDMWRIIRQLEVVPPSWQADSLLVAAESTGR